VSDDGEGTEEMVDDDDGVEHHKESLGDVEVVVERPISLGLKVLDAVVRQVADSSTGQGGQLERGNIDDAVLGDLGLQGLEGVANGIIAPAGLEDLSRVCWWLGDTGLIRHEADGG